MCALINIFGVGLTMALVVVLLVVLAKPGPEERNTFAPSGAEITVDYRKAFFHLNSL